jgi:hypothetical protein
MQRKVYERLICQSVIPRTVVTVEEHVLHREGESLRKVDWRGK